MEVSQTMPKRLQCSLAREAFLFPRVTNSKPQHDWTLPHIVQRQHRCYITYNDGMFLKGSLRFVAMPKVHSSITMIYAYTQLCKRQSLASTLEILQQNPRSLAQSVTRMKLIALTLKNSITFPNRCLENHHVMSCERLSASLTEPHHTSYSWHCAQNKLIKAMLLVGSGLKCLPTSQYYVHNSHVHCAITTTNCYLEKFYNNYIITMLEMTYP